MTDLHSARIEVDGARSAVFLDDKALAVQSVTLCLRAGSMPVLTLSIPLKTVTVNGWVLLNLSDTDEELLCDLGWVPPDERG